MPSIALLALAAAIVLADQPDLHHLQHHVLRHYNHKMQAQQQQGTTAAPGGGGGGGGGGSQPPGTTQPPATTQPPFGTTQPPSGAFGGGFDDKESPDMCRRGSHFQIASDRVATVCAGANYTVLKAATKYADIAQADLDWNDFCTSFCVSTMAGFMQFQEFGPCLNEETNSFIAPILAMCQRRNGRYCGATLNTLSTTCENKKVAKNQTACQATTGCAWKSDHCADDNATVIYDRMCDPCVQDLLSSFGPESEDAKTLTFACKKIGGKYCELEVGDLVPQMKNLTWFTQSNINSVCSPNSITRYQCLSFYAGKDFTTRMDSASTAYQACVKTSSGAPACLQQLQIAQQGVFDDSRRIALMCDSFNGTNGPDYCLPRVQGVLDNECFQRVSGTFKGTTGMMTTTGFHSTTDFATSTDLGTTSDAATTSGDFSTTAPPQTTGPASNCPSGCDAELASILNIGCCVGTIDEYLRVVFNFTANNVPALGDVKNEDLPSRPPPLANLSKVASCSSVANISDRAKTTCATAPVATPPRALHFRLNSSYILAAAPIRDRLIAAILEDLASIVGIRASEFIDAQLQANATSVFAGNFSGLTLTFKIWTRRSDVQDFARNEFDRLFGVDQIVLPNAVKFLKQCPLCTGRSGTADFIVQNKGPLQLPSTVRGDICMTTQYFDIELGLDRECGASSALDALSHHEGDTTNKTRTAIGTMCNGNCAKKLRDVINSPFATCLPSDISAIAALIAVSCSKSGPMYCGEALTIVDQLQCDKLANETACKVRPQCVWNKKSNVCFNDPSAAFLAPLCNECMGRYVAAMAAEKGSLANLIISTDAVLCARDSKTGALCRPMVSFELNTANDEGFSEPLTAGLCKNATKRRCFKRVYVGQASLWKMDAEDTFAACSVANNYEPDAVNSKCAPALFTALAKTEQFEDVVSKMCIVQPGTGHPCLGFAEKFANNSCITTITNSGTCNATCDAELKALVEQMGCCAGTIHSIFGRATALQPDELPNFGADEQPTPGQGQQGGQPGQTTAFATSKAPQQTTTVSSLKYGPGENASNVEEVVPTQGFMQLWSVCPSLSDIATSSSGLRKVCKKLRPSGGSGATVVRNLSMGIAFDKVSGKTGRRMIAALMTDLGNKLGLSKDDFDGTKFMEDTKKSVVTPKRTAAAGRGMWIQSVGTNAPSSSSTVSITMSASTNEDGSNAASQYDSLVSSGELTLPNTVKTGSNECKGCVSADGGFSSLQSSATVTTLSNSTNTTATPAPSGATGLAIRTAVFLVIATLFAMIG